MNRILLGALAALLLASAGVFWWQGRAATERGAPPPAALPEQMRAVAALLTASGRPLALETVEAAFTGRGPWKRRIPPILEALAALGRARQVNGMWTLG